MGMSNSVINFKLYQSYFFSAATLLNLIKLAKTDKQIATIPMLSEVMEKHIRLL